MIKIKPSRGVGSTLIKYLCDNYKKNYQNDFKHSNPPIVYILTLVKSINNYIKKTEPQSRIFSPNLNINN